jgi:hypothetical protein
MYRPGCLHHLSVGVDGGGGGHINLVTTMRVYRNMLLLGSDDGGVSVFCLKSFAPIAVIDVNSASGISTPAMTGGGGGGGGVGGVGGVGVGSDNAMHGGDGDVDGDVEVTALTIFLE